MKELFLFLNQFGDISRPGEYNNCLERGGLFVRHQNSILCFHSRGQHLCKFIRTKEIVYIRKEFNSHRTGLGQQYGRHVVMWKHTICVFSTHVTDREAYWMWMLREKEDRSLTAASTEHFLPSLATILFIYSLMILCVGLEEVPRLQLWACVHIARYKNFKVHVLS